MFDKEEWVRWDIRLRKYIQQEDTVQVGKISDEMCNWMTECNESTWYSCNNEIPSIGSSIARQLENFIEIKAYVWEDSPGYEECMTDWVDKVLILISYLHKMMAVSCFHLYQKGNDDTVTHFEDILDKLLLWGVSSKRANLMSECVEAHRLRMHLSPELKQLDAVRLIGLNSSHNTFAVDHFSKTGIFEVEILKHFYGETMCETYVATQRAIALGRDIHELLTMNDYTYFSCCKMLHWILHSRSCLHHEFDARRMYCANTFFNHRNEALLHFDDLPTDFDCATIVLAFLFIFGVALDRATVEKHLGMESSMILLDACLVREHPFDSNLIFPQVQIFPLSSCTFVDPWKTDGKQLYFMTDWYMESLRLPQNAIMSVGYDTMELLALSSGFESTRRCDEVKSLLDLCSGCGIQGIYFAKKYHLQGKVTFMDINERSCHFVTANASINGLYDDESRLQIVVVEANLFDPVKLCDDTSRLKVDVGCFDIIVSNPPFVAVPSSTSVTLKPSLFSFGGGHDGMQLLRKMLKQVLHHMHDSESKLLMVTELPNVEESCEILDMMLGPDKAKYIRVAYVEKDVEFSDDYAAVRETEAGFNIVSRDWAARNIRNRALVLLTIEPRSSLSQCHGLFCYHELGTEQNDEVQSDEEDLFLTPKGIKFVWENLLGAF